MRLDTPIKEALSDELFRFWGGVFGDGIDAYPAALTGEESESNRDIVYLDRRGDKLAGTCLLTVSCRVPILGGLGEVATGPEFRRSGIATKLCRQALDDFRESGGQAFFLGGGNPEADRIYHRLGWRKLASTKAMANISGGDSPETFLVDYFRGLRPAAVRQATADERVAIIPLLLRPHDWQVLDANVAMFSTRYAVQRSCMSLYLRYSAIARDDQGAWFSAVTADGRALGLATARLDGTVGCQVDGFTVEDHLDLWDRLIKTAMAWGAGHGASSFHAVVSAEDEEKRALFESTGFRAVGRADPFDLGGREVPSVLLKSDSM